MRKLETNEYKGRKLQKFTYTDTAPNLKTFFRNKQRFTDTRARSIECTQKPET